MGKTNGMSEDLIGVLRITPEPYTYFTDLEVHHRLTSQPLHYYRFVWRALAGAAAGDISFILPPKQIFDDQDGNGDFRVMPCVTRLDNKVTKTIKIVGTNTRQVLIPDQITVGKAFVVDPAENFISHIFEACLLSSARTGICAALAVDLLGGHARKITILGAGRVGYYSAFYICSVFGIDQVLFYDPVAGKAEKCAIALNRQLNAPVCRAVSAPFQEDPDIIILATTSSSVICGPFDCKASLVISLGADCDSQHELDPVWAEHADFFVDTMDSLRFGDLKLWLRQGRIQQKGVTDLLSLIRMGKDGLTPNRYVFISTGSALFDNLTIAYILQQTQR